MLLAKVVLIVAKCNVNDFSSGISNPPFNVLIVAKCNVNQKGLKRYEARKKVLIVAKCNVNTAINAVTAKITMY